MISDLKGQVAIVTGSTSGIGHGLADALGAAGVNLVINGLGDPAAIEATRADLARRHGVEVRYHAADMTRPDQIADMVTSTVAAFGRLDILVNNAGVQHVSPIEDFPLDWWDRIIAINLSSVFHATRAAIPPMNPDDEKSPDPSVLWWRTSLGSADAVLIASPEYAGSIAGVVKNALDWIVGSGELYSKPVALISAGTSGGVHARRALVQTLTWQGAHVVGSIGISSPNTKSVVEPGGARRFTDPSTIVEIESLAGLLVESLALSAADRRAVVRSIVDDAGVDPAHIAPL